MNEIHLSNQHKTNTNLLIVRWLLSIVSIFVVAGLWDKYTHSRNYIYIVLSMAVVAGFLLIIFVLVPWFGSSSVETIDVSDEGLTVKSRVKTVKYSWDDVTGVRTRVDTDGPRGGARLVVQILCKDVLANISSPRSHDLPYVDGDPMELANIIRSHLDNSRNRVS